MTPKEKAEELEQEFWFRIDEYIQPKTWDEVEMLNKIKNKAAKACAELAVEEIIESNPYKIALEGKFLTEHIKYDINYWLEVKKEIEKL